MRALFGFLLLALAAPLAAADDRPIVDDRGQKKEDRARRELPTLWIAGDSTVKSNGALRGWGQEIGAFFDPAKINVVNRAIGGRSSRTFYTEGRWNEILGQIRQGDFVVIQFGHNDVGPTDARSKFRGSVKGIGDETEEVEKPDGTLETVHSYGWYLKEYARTAKAKGATVILCSPVPHKRFDRNGHYTGDWEDWARWVGACAKEEQVEFIDLAKLIGKKYERLGLEKVEPLFADKGTHTTAEGAKLNAEILVEALKKLPGKPLRRSFN
ncbi:rhamnogalacturonan acetylesterase [Haloferula sargassicola]